jgi:tRNA-specific 2-thiouridylase
MHKTDVRDLARKLDLPAAERPESQEICFVPNDDYRAFLKEHAPSLLRPGELVMTDGKVVGRHDGISLFTVGQRRKLGVAAGERLYVVRIEPETNRVVLGNWPNCRRGNVASNPTWTMMDNRRPRGNGQDTLPLAFVPATITPLADQRVQVSL